MAAAAVATPSPRGGGLMGHLPHEMGALNARPRAKRLTKTLSEGTHLSTKATVETLSRDNEDPHRRNSSPTEKLFLNLNETGLTDDETGYTPRESRNPSPVLKTPRRRQSVRRRLSTWSNDGGGGSDLSGLTDDETGYTPRESRNPSPVLKTLRRRQSVRRRLSTWRDDRRLSQLSGDLGLTSRRPPSDNDSVFGSPTKPIIKKRGSILRRKSSFGGFTAPSSPTPVLANPKKPLRKNVSFSYKNSETRDSVSESLPNTSRRMSKLEVWADEVERLSVGDLSKTPRRMSMMSTLREKMMQVDKVNVKKYNQTAETNQVRDMSAKREKSDEFYASRLNRQNYLKMAQRPSMPRLLPRSDSLEDDALLSSYEMKKFQMLQSLQNMGVDLKKMRSQQVVQNDESAILRQAARGNRHGSLTSRTILSNFGNVKSTISNPNSGQGVEELDAVTREKLQKVYEMMIKPVPKVTSLPGLLGRTRHSVTSDEIAQDTVNVFKRRIRRKKKQSNRFRRLSRFVLVLLRLWGHHASQVNQMLDHVQSVDMDDKNKKEDLLFDITEFKAEKEAHVPMEAKRILRKRPNERSEDEIHYLQIALRNYKALAEYPVHMQRRIAERAWFEDFGAKRVIVREGHLPMCFYFVMSGSAVVSVMDLDKGVAKTVLYYGRGDSFGELAIMNATRRQSTVISKEPIELLVLTDEDFVDIFMSGGLSNPEDPFLNSLPYLDGWPIEKLGENPKKAQFCYYKRGAILVKDSKDNDWIVIVKSGSCNLLVKMKHVDPTKPRKERAVKIPEFREALLDDFNVDQLLNHEERLQLAYQTEIKNLESQNQLMRFYALPEIFIPPNDEYKELKRFHQEHSEHVGVSFSEKLKESAVLSRNPSNMSTEKSRTGSGFGLLPKKGPYMSKSRTRDSKGEMSKDGTGHGTSFSDFLKENAPSPSMQDLTKEKKKVEQPPMFVNVQTLTKGMVFGLSDIFFDEQPSLTLVSNGAECITISKKLYMDHATHAFTTRLREDIYPYPSTEDLQENLELQVYWNHHKRSQIGNVVHDINFKRSEPHDARARFTPDIDY